MQRGPRRPASKRWRYLGLLIIIVGAILIFRMWGSSDKAAPPAQAAIPVGTVTMAEQDAQVWSSFSGRLQPVDSAEIRPEVSGRITKVLFQDGKLVKAGDTLFVIDPGPYEAAVSKAEADLAAAETNSKFAALEQKRAGSMVKSQAIAQRLFDERANTNRVAAATVKNAEAQLKQAKIDLDRAYVKAPISGRVGRVEITVGNVVQAGPNAPVLTSIVANDAVYADFEVDEQTYTQTIRRNANQRVQERRIPVELTLQGDAQPYTGTIYSFDNKLDAASGTIRARAKFANKDGALLPGMFVSVRLAGSSKSSVMLVPERAIGFDQNKKFVFVVGADKKVEYREVALGDKIADSRIVTSGLNEGDRLVVDGVQHVRPGAVVDAKEAGAPETVADASKN
jgi:multidrug efflux system membrane fusion protein